MKNLAWCPYCQRGFSAHCRNTRDMDPDDGHNFDPMCHDALVVLGGGERLRTARELALIRVDKKYPEVPK